MANNFYVELDLSGLKAGADRLSRLTRSGNVDAINRIADMLLTLSQKEVPHDKGTLQNSGHVDQAKDIDSPEAVVSYGGMAAPYAAYLHEHPEFNFQAGRKGKYLEDPLKNNLNIFKNIYSDIMKVEVFNQ
jgi:hypothetical protein